MSLHAEACGSGASGGVQRTIVKALFDQDPEFLKAMTDLTLMPHAIRTAIARKDLFASPQQAGWLCWPIPDNAVTQRWDVTVQGMTDRLSGMAAMGEGLAPAPAADLGPDGYHCRADTFGKEVLTNDAGRLVYRTSCSKVAGNRAVSFTAIVERRADGTYASVLSAPWGWSEDMIGFAPNGDILALDTRPTTRASRDVHQGGQTLTLYAIAAGRERVVAQLPLSSNPSAKIELGAAIFGEGCAALHASAGVQGEKDKVVIVKAGALTGLEIDGIRSWPLFWDPVAKGFRIAIYDEPSPSSDLPTRVRTLHCDGSWRDEPRQQGEFYYTDGMVQVTAAGTPWLFYAFGSPDIGRAVLVDLRTHKAKLNANGDSFLPGSLNTAVFSPHGRYLAVSSNGTRLDVYSTDDWALAASWPAKACGYPVSSMAFLADEKTVVMPDCGKVREFTIGRAEPIVKPVTIALPQQ